MGHLVAAAVALPGWFRGSVRVEGPDEDAFTLLVRGGELLRRAQPRSPEARSEVRTVRLVSELPGEDRDLLFEAWGMPPVELVAYPNTSAGAAQALADALDRSGPPHEGPTWVLGVQVSRPVGSGTTDPPRQSAGAVALSIAPGPSPPPAASAPRTWVTGGASAPADAPALRVPALRAAPDAPLRILLTLVEAASQGPPGARGAWMHASGERTAVREFLDGGEVVLVGYPVPEGEEHRELLEGPWRSLAGAPLGSVSQGAYLPKETYRLSLPARWRLEGEQCGTCDGWTLPPVGRCHRCGAREKLRRGRLSRQGAKVETATVIRAGAQPTEFDFHQETYGPYGVALVRFPEGALLTFQLTDQQPASPPVGRAVELVLRRLYPQEGEWRYGLKALLLPEGAETPSTGAARRGRPG